MDHCMLGFLENGAVETNNNSNLRIQFLKEEHAQMARDVLAVDKELKEHEIQRTLSVDGNFLIGYINVHCAHLLLTV